MSGPLLRPKREKAAPARLGEDGVDVLVRQLIKQLENYSAAGTFAKVDSNGRTVMLDVEVDGVRCLVFRMPTGACQARVVLSPREREIVRMVAKGYPNKTIAGVLDISAWTVGTYLRRVFAKLGVGSRAAMVARLLADAQLDNPPGASLRG